MMNYKKGKNVEVDIQRDEIPIAGLPTKFLWMHVSYTGNKNTLDIRLLNITPIKG